MNPKHGFLCLVLVVSGCGPGATDGAYAISNGYLFYDTGGNGKTIRREERKGWSVTVIPERVDAYLLDGKHIIVARRPAEAATRGQNADWKLEATCEYWMIDTETHDVKSISDAGRWPSVVCSRKR